MTPEHHEQVCELFLKAIELEGEERNRFLNEVCDSDALLRLDVEKMLNADSTQSQLDDITTAQAELDRQARALREAPLPKQIGAFEIVDVLGEGGMGMVYRAQQERPRRTVALKVIRPGLAAERVLRHFEHEVQVLGRLQHPGIAQIFEAGTSETAAGLQPYFALELVQGLPLLHHCEAQGLGVEERLQLFTQICDAVHHAHLRGVIHRDLKPANILVDPAGQPKVLDFGIARVTDVDAHTLAQTGEGSRLIGTVPYMSPEQASENFADLDARSDVYTLGVLLYELLTGTLPYSVREKSLIEAARTICEQPPAPLHRVQAYLRGDVEAIVLKALRKDREQRYSSASELGADLQRHLNHQPIEARPPSLVYTARKFSQRHRAAVAGAAAFLLTLMGGLAVSTALWIQAEQAKALAVGAQAMAEEARAHAEIEEQRANEHLSKYERLADVRILQELRDQAPQDLWPRRPEQADSMLAWLEIAEKLRDNRSHHQATLAQLLDSSTSDTSESPEFASNKQAWHYEVLNGLLVDLQHFSSEQGLYRVALKNLEVAHSVEQRTLRDHEAEWEEAIFAIQESSHYHGLEISMQIGLVPLGEDPETGLWEFWLWESGQRPRRDSESGRWQMDAEVGMILVLLPSGSFTLGATAASDRLAQEYEKPLRTLSLPAFLISKYEMTQGQWLRTRGENPSYYHPENTNVLVTSHLGHPVETVSWLECMETVHSLGLDLPTEAQWEYAARAGTRTIWSSGDDPQSLRLVANLADAFAARHGGPPEWSYDSWDDGFAGHAPVGKLEPNPFGLHDVHGNVSEWCRDAFGVYSLPTVGEDALREVSGGDTRVYRGGSLATTAQLSRSACRQHNRPEFRVYDLGLRPIRALQR